MADVESLELQIKGNASGATRSLNTLISTLEKLEKATAGGCGLSSVTREMDRLKNVSIGLSSSNRTSAKSFANLATKVTAAYLSLKKGASIVASWIHESNDYVENMNLFNVAMGQYAESAMDYANKVSDAMGIDTSEWIRAQGVFMTLSTGFGVASDRANTMSQQLTQLGYDISSFYNISVSEAMSKLKSGLAGELEPLRSLGYDLSQAKLEATALSLGIDKAVSSMTQAEKAELRYYAIMTQVTQVQGDMARTLNDPANQLRIFRAQLDMAARSLGNIFIPALNAILPYAIAAAKVIRVIADAVAALFNFTIPEIDYSGASDVGNNVAEGFEDANKEVTKMKKTLLGIDELNVLGDRSSASGSDIGGGSFDFNLPTYDFIGEATNSRVNEIVEEMKKWLGITEDINSWSDLLDTRFGSILKTVGLIGLGIAAWKVTKGTIDAITTLNKLLSSPSYSIAIGVMLTVTGFAISFSGMKDAIKRGLDGFNFAEIIGGSLLGAGGAALLGTKLATWITTAFSGSKVATALTTAAINLFGKTAGPITAGAVSAAGGVLAAAISGVVLGIPMYIVGIRDALLNGIDWLSAILIPAGATAAGAGIGAIIGAAVGSIGGPAGAAVGAVVGVAVGLITDLVILAVQNWETIAEWWSHTCTAIGQFFGNLWDGIVSIWNTVATWFDTKVIQPVVGFFSGLWTSVSGFFVNLWADIVGIYTAVSEWFNTMVIQPVVNFFVGLWTSIATTASECWVAIVSFFTPAYEWFAALFGSIAQTLSDIFYNIGVIASGCWEIIKAVWGLVSAWFDTNVIQPVCEFFTELWNTVSTAAINAWEGIKAVFAQICGWIDTYIIQPVSTFFTNLWTGIANGAIAAWEGIKSAYASVTTWIDTNIIQPVGDFFSDLWEGFVEGADKAWQGVKTVFGNVTSFFKETFQKAWKGVVNVFSIAGEIFVDIKDGILAGFKKVVNGIIGGLNSAIAVPFNGINSALKMIKDIEIVGIKPFDGLRTISVPQIPKLAEGGMVGEGQMFIAREAGPELVGTIGNRSAVVNNDQIVSSVSKGVYQAVVQAMGQSGNQTVEAKVNDKVLFEVIVNRNRQETMRTGYSPLLGGA
jgi:hypothetical protein